MSRAFRVLVASDGSPAAGAAVIATLLFPWPTGAQAHVIVARGQRHRRARGGVARLRAERVTGAARRVLARRWPDVQTTVVGGAPVEAIIGLAKRSRIRAIALGWRGHGALRRLVMGSVSRAVVRRAPCPVLVVRRTPRAIRRLVIGLDGSPNARRAVAFIARLVPPSDGRATVLRVVELMRAPSTRRMPRSVGGTLRMELAAVNAARMGRARRDVRRAASRLRAAGWAVNPLVRSGVQLRELLSTVKVERADLLVVGARGARGVERLLLGSVAEGALSRLPVPVLVVR